MEEEDSDIDDPDPVQAQVNVSQFFNKKCKKQKIKYENRKKQLYIKDIKKIFLCNCAMCFKLSVVIQELKCLKNLQFIK